MHFPKSDGYRHHIKQETGFSKAQLINKKDGFKPLKSELEINHTSAAPLCDGKCIKGSGSPGYPCQPSTMTFQCNFRKKQWPLTIKGWKFFF